MGCVALGVAGSNWLMYQRRQSDDRKRLWYRHAAWLALAWAVFAFGRGLSGH